jgi:hypothetical protein
MDAEDSHFGTDFHQGESGLVKGEWHDVISWLGKRILEDVVCTIALKAQGPFIMPTKSMGWMQNCRTVSKAHMTYLYWKATALTP